VPNRPPNSKISIENEIDEKSVDGLSYTATIYVKMFELNNNALLQIRFLLP